MLDSLKTVSDSVLRRLLPKPDAGASAETAAAFPSPHRTARLLFIDGLRGLAAFAVMLHHFAHHPTLEDRIGWLPSLAEFGNLGVPAFFVISGFVIAHSISGQRITRGYFGNFVVRRVVRLDPPYWFAIAFCIATTALGNRLFPSQARDLPSPGSVVAHLFYVYPLFGYEPIEAIFWTLVHEVQFYLLYLLLVAWMQQTTGRTDPSPATAACFIAIPGLISAAWTFQAKGLCLGTWYMFSLGAMAYYCRRGWIGGRLAMGYWVGVAATIPWKSADYKLAALAIALTFMGATERQFRCWLSSVPFQFLGRLSYSLYLIHGMIGWRVLSVAGSLGMTSAPFTLLAVACGASIVAACLMRIGIEEPSLRLAQSLKQAERGIPHAGPSA